MSDLRRSRRQKYRKIHFDQFQAYLEANSVKSRENALDFIEIRPIEQPALQAVDESTAHPIYPSFLH